VATVRYDNGQTDYEEIASSVTHGVGALLAAAGTAALVVVAARHGGAVDIVSSAVYGASLTALFTVSCLYHAVSDPNAKALLQLLDHCSIFLLILGSYTPLCFTVVKGGLGWALWGANAACAAVGIAFNLSDMHRWFKLSMTLYVAMGWMVVVAARPIVPLLRDANGLLLVLGGGLCYTAGCVFFTTRRPAFVHAIWHVFVLAGAMMHYIFMLLFIIG